MQSVIKEKGSKDIVYVDESGFDEHTYRPHAWAKRGKKSYDERSGKRGVRTNLIVGKRGKALLAPILYEDTTTALWVNKWMEDVLCKELRPDSTIIMDNARFHIKKEIHKIAKINGHTVIFLPPYSPDFNPIEQVFANLKQKRSIAPPNTSIDEVIKSAGLFLE